MNQSAGTNDVVGLATLAAKEFWAMVKAPSNKNYYSDSEPLTLQDSTYHTVNMSELPASFADGMPCPL